MKKYPLKTFVFFKSALGFILFFALFFFNSCRPNINYIKRMQSLEEGVNNPTTEKELVGAIQKYQQRVEDIMAAQSQTGIWYKILGVRYLDNKMYGEALKAFQKAVEYYPDNQNLYYYVAVCAAYMAKSDLDYAVSGLRGASPYLSLAESAYKHALEIEPGYVRSLYGLAVLYVFEMDRASEAIPLLERLLGIDTGHTDAMFILARAYYMAYEFQAAADMYDRILEHTKDKVKREEAAANKKTALDALFLQ